MKPLRKEIRLIPKTLKGKNRIREAGTDIWEVHIECGQFNFINCFLIAPKDLYKKREEKMRWVAHENDPDFDWEWIIPLTERKRNITQKMWAIKG